ncbi:LTA synthase family protein [Paenibacillus sp.]|jgi:phosphoglycerol transferase MdoB-like AlkP superfamily enzyme|uniref:LTA synthase family protein n=1 Tax=Paenibacillus sp. TaxID=58172 RepID=UPI00282079BA|nr:LTA synthase family protein [Paenibacillus sp.]MDR0268137.1 LTA synthase family protein [Paenibacillus sp.]
MKFMRKTKSKYYFSALITGIGLAVMCTAGAFAEGFQKTENSAPASKTISNDQHLQKLERKSYFAAAKGYHLIMVQFESLQNFVLNTSIEKQQITPVLNALSKESLYFPHVFQQIGAGNTSDAEFLSNTSIYPFGASAMSHKYGNRKLSSLAKLMQGKGYVANTFHVNDVSFWNRDQLYPALGFDKYYDKQYFNGEKFNRFGPSDEELFHVGADKLQEMDQRHKKFYSQFVTASSHSPFIVPDDKKRLNLSQHLQKGKLGHYLTAINYSDYALGTFIERLKQNGLWDKSVLVVYGDHFGLNKKLHDPKKISQTLGIPYHKQLSTFNIPFIIHLPGQLHGQDVDRVGGQIDFLPTIANIMGIDLDAEGFKAFGHDLLNVKHNIIGIRYYLPTGAFFNDEVFFKPGKNGFEDGTATSIRTLQCMKDISKYKPDYDYIKKWMKASDRYVQRLPVREDPIRK